MPRRPFGAVAMVGAADLFGGRAPGGGVAGSGAGPTGANSGSAFVSETPPAPPPKMQKRRSWGADGADTNREAALVCAC
jgi:hypothetical protein